MTELQYSQGIQLRSNKCHFGSLCTQPGQRLKNWAVFHDLLQGTSSEILKGAVNTLPLPLFLLLQHYCFHILTRPFRP